MDEKDFGRGSMSSEYKLTGITKDSGGIYTCTFKNRFGNLARKSFQVTVAGADL